MPKVNYLKDMKIHEVSLVMEPACPGAVVLFTKTDVSNEPRDARGRWTSAAVAAIGHAKDATRAVAQALTDRAKRAAEATVGNTVHAIKTTRAKGAFPVQGGGIQFDFEHHLRDNTRVDTSVQIRPEHLGEQKHLKRGLGALHRVLSTGGMEQKQPFGLQAYGYRSGPTATGGPFSGWWRAHFTRPSLPFVSPTQQTQSNTNGRPAPAPMSSDGPGGVKRVAPGGVPEYVPHEVPPNWAVQATQGRLQRVYDSNGVEVPRVGITANEAGGNAYYTPKGDFVPSLRADVQQHIEGVHDFTRTDAGKAVMASSRQRNLTPQSSAGRAFFSSEGFYVPYGSERFQRGALERYRAEADRVRRADTKDAAADGAAGIQPPAPHEPKSLFEPGQEPGVEAMKSADDEIAQFLRERGATKIPPVDTGEAPSLLWAEGQRRPTVSKKLF